MSLQLAVAIYGTGHWSLYAADDVNDRSERGTIFEASGLKNRLSFKAFHANPQSTDRFQRMYYLGEIDDNVLNEVHGEIADIPIRNRLPYWDCQNWTINVMDKLEALGFLDGDDARYSHTKETLQEIIASTRPDGWEEEEEESSDDNDGDDDDGDDVDDGDDGDDDDGEDDDDDDEDDEPMQYRSEERVEDSDDE